MRTATTLDYFLDYFLNSSKTAICSTLVMLAAAGGLAIAPSSGFAAQPTSCPMALLGDPTGNVCTASDINIATAVVGSGQAVDYCLPGDTVGVEIEADFTVRNQTRYDPGIWIATDGLALDVSIADGGAVDCEVLPVQGQHNSQSDPSDPPFEIDSFDSGEDICNDTNGDQNNAVINGVPLTFPGGAAYDDPITLDCIAGPTGLLVLQALVSWNQNNPGVCNPTMPSTYDLDNTAKCSYEGPIELDVDVVGRVTVVKNAPGGGMTDFEFTWSRDNAPQFAMVDPSNPFLLQDGQSQEILGEIGTTGGAEIVITEQNLPMGWNLTGINCTGDDIEPAVVDVMNGTVTVPLVYDDQDPGNSQSDVTCTFSNNMGTPDVQIIKDGIINNGGDGVVNPGDLINYTFDVTNTGSVELTDLEVTDPLISTIDCGGDDTPPQIASLGTGATVQCTGSYAVTQMDIDAGLVMNTASVSADCESGCPVMDSDDNTETIPRVPTIDIVKTGVLSDGGDGIANSGDVITYTLTVTNTGNVTLTNVTVTDPLPGLSMITCPMPGNGSIELAPGDSVMCTATYPITQADIDAGGVMNTASVSGDCPQQDDCANDADPETVPLAAVPAVEIVKTGALDLGGNGIADPGDVINYMFQVTNTGNVTLTSVAVTDPLIAGIMCTGGNPIPTMAPADVVNCTGSYTIDQADINAGVVDNTVTASGMDPTGGPVMDTDDWSEPIPQTPAVEIVKSGALDLGGDGIANPGDVIDYTFQVTNTGNVTLTSVAVTDPLVSPITCTGGNPIPTMAPGDVVDCTGSYAIVQGDIDAGVVNNTATANGMDPAGAPVMDTDDWSEPIPQTPAVEIVKTADPQEYSEVGEVITYTLMVTNTGNLTLVNVAVTDPLVSPINCPGGNPIPSLAPGASVSCMGDYTIVQDDLLAGQVTNVASVSAECIVIGRGEECASDDDEEVIDFVPPRTTFRVTKDFSDDNPAGVTVTIQCNTGLPLMQQGVVHDPDAAGLQPGDFTVIEFIVNDFEPGTMDCDIDEVIPEGYEPEYSAGADMSGIADLVDDDDEGCHFEGVYWGGFTCHIYNDLQPVDVVVEKEWIDDHPEYLLPTFVEITLQCDGPIEYGYSCGGDYYCIQEHINPDNPGEFEVLPHFEGTTCSATEEPIVGVLTDASDCEEMIVFPGQDDSCVIVNTRLFAGIPALNQYGLMLLALLMLGLGAVAYRRFV